MYQLDKNIHHSQIGYLSFRLLALVLFGLSKICEVQGFQYILFKTFEYTYILHQNNQIRTVCNYTYFKTGKQQLASFKIQSFTKDIKSCIILAIIDKIFVYYTYTSEIYQDAIMLLQATNLDNLSKHFYRIYLDYQQQINPLQYFIMRVCSYHFGNRVLISTSKISNINIEHNL
ncbi:Hypothetical_protein [Hexamita inflata]|uniref:Hypothetical_protein n=1 Tax=Hexamita inflata TaxID=28002 RepID=A0AA86NQG2_9EUKA|nr:Hypothetical protein HINF_LOCUS11344 [Hexamita inflata]